eukprot:Hpha_TRINITY_DN14108_c0_g4::TRINITY_DN14108_c0_g4_i2::g.10808::m.10808
MSHNEVSNVFLGSEPEVPRIGCCWALVLLGGGQRGPRYSSFWKIAKRRASPARIRWWYFRARQRPTGSEGMTVNMSVTCRAPETRDKKVKDRKKMKDKKQSVSSTPSPFQGRAVLDP